MSEREDEFEFDFFDEPDEETVTQRRRAVRPRPPAQRRAGRPPRGPAGPPAGFTPILRLIGLIAAAILVVVLLVFWVQGCQNDAKARAYRNYMEDVSAIAKASRQIGANLNTQLVTPGVRKAELEAKLDGLAQQEQQNVTRAQALDPPGHLREPHQHVIEALQLRVSGLRGISDAFRSTTRNSNADKAGVALAEQAKRLIASDVVWDDLFKVPAKKILDEEGVAGVAVPDSHFVSNVDLTTAATFAAVVKRVQGASTSGAGGGSLHGTGIVSVTALPQGLELSQSSDNTVVATTTLAFSVVVEDTGENPEGNIPVTLTIQKQGTPIKQTQTIKSITPGQTKTLVFRNIDTTGVFGVRTNLKVDVQPVTGEANISNNSYQYPVIFSLSP